MTMHHVNKQTQLLVDDSLIYQVLIGHIKKETFNLKKDCLLHILDFQQFNRSFLDVSHPALLCLKDIKLIVASNHCPPIKI